LTLERPRGAAVLLVIAVIAPVAAAHAQGVEGTRSVTLFVGTGLSLAGNAINEGVGTIDGKPSVTSNRPSATISDGLRLRFTGSLGLDYNKEVLRRLLSKITAPSARGIGVRPSSQGSLSMPTPSTSKAASVITCARGPIRTYVAGAAACAFPRRPTPPSEWSKSDDQPNQPLRAGPVFGGDAGVSYDVSDTIALGVELGLRTQGKPGAEPLFADRTSGRQRHGRRWSLPISVFAKARF
jgi:hypothetical protein